MLRDIRDLTSDPEAYAAELQQRWGGLLSYRYIGRPHAPMNVGPVDDTVTVRKDMRNDATKWRFLTVVIGVSKPWQDATMELAAGNHMISAQKTPPT